MASKIHYSSLKALQALSYTKNNSNTTSIRFKQNAPAIPRSNNHNNLSGEWHVISITMLSQGLALQNPMIVEVCNMSGRVPSQKLT